MHLGALFFITFSVGAKIEQIKVHHFPRAEAIKKSKEKKKKEKKKIPHAWDCLLVSFWKVPTGGLPVGIWKGFRSGLGVFSR